MALWDARPSCKVHASAAVLASELDQVPHLARGGQHEVCQLPRLDAIEVCLRLPLRRTLWVVTELLDDLAMHLYASPHWVVPSHYVQVAL